MPTIANRQRYGTVDTATRQGKIALGSALHQAQKASNTAFRYVEAGDLDGALTVADEALMAAVSHGGAHGAHYGLRAMIHRSRGEASGSTSRP